MQPLEKYLPAEDIKHVFPRIRVSVIQICFIIDKNNLMFYFFFLFVLGAFRYTL